MSATQVPLQPIKKGSLTKLWLAIALLVAAGLALAWLGTRGFAGETTESGVFVRTIAEGTGEPISDDDGAFVIYRGTLADGTEFDSSNGQPVPMLLGGVIPGFAEALKQMREGGSYEIRIPSDQAYGSEDRTDPNGNVVIPANSDLHFEIEIAQIVRDAALMAQQRPPLPQGEPIDVPVEPPVE